MARASATAVRVRSRRARFATLERVGMQGRLGRVLGQQEPRRLERLPHPAGRVEARREGERDRLEVDGGRVDPGALEQRGDARPRVPPEPLEPEPGDRPVLADDRRHVGDRADRGQVGQVERGLRSARQVGQEQLGDLERDAAAGQAAVRDRSRPAGAG